MHLQLGMDGETQVRELLANRLEVAQVVGRER